MSYLREVAYELRKRGVSERHVAMKISELSAVDDPQQRFGSPEEVALSVPEGSHRSMGQRFVRIGIALTVLLIGWFVWNQAVAKMPVSVASLVLPTVVLVGFVAAGAVLDRRLPRGVGTFEG